jgi:NADPH2:quinone reductase
LSSRSIGGPLSDGTSPSLLTPLQLGKYFGANVIGTVSTPEKAALAKSNGADHILLTSSPSSENVSAILSLTGGKGVHAVYDGVGKDTWEEDFEVVRPKATIVTFGNASGPVPPFAPLKLSPKALKVTRPTLGPFIAEPEDFARYAKEIFEIVQKGGLKVS